MFYKIILACSCVATIILAADNHEEQIAQKNKYYKVFSEKPCTECTNAKSADFGVDALGTKFSEINETIKKYNMSKPKSPNKEASKQAGLVDSTVKSEKGQSNISQMKQTILKDSNYSYKGQETSPWKKAYDNSKTYSAVEDMPIGGKSAAQQILAPKERLFIVVSSSMPDNVVKEYLRTVTESLNGQATVLMRGFVGGMAKMKQTVDYVKRVSEDGKYVGVEVHPNVVKQYGVERVPAVLYVKDYDPANDGGNGQFKKNNDYYIVYGAVSLNAAVKKIHEKYPSKGLSKMLSKLNGEGQGFYGNSK